MQLDLMAYIISRTLAKHLFFLFHPGLALAIVRASYQCVH